MKAIAIISNTWGEPIAAPLEFIADMPLARGYGRSLLEAFRMAAADVEHEGGLLADPFTLASFEQFVLTGLLLSHPHCYQNALQRRAKPAAPADVRRAIDFMEANFDAPIGLPEIVAAAGIPGRTLVKHFRDFRGTSPMRYLRRVRFQKVHRALRAASSVEAASRAAISGSAQGSEARAMPANTLSTCPYSSRASERMTER